MCQYLKLYLLIKNKYIKNTGGLSFVVIFSKNIKPPNFWT